MSATGTRPSSDQWVLYSESFDADCPSEGPYVLFAYAEDRAGNRENPVAAAGYNCLF